MIPHHVWFWVAMLALSTGAGLVYDALFSNGIPVVAAVYGFCIGVCGLLLERGLLVPRLQARCRQLPTLLYVPLAELAYVGMIALGHGLGGLLVWGTGLSRDRFVDAVIPSPRALVYALAVSALLVFVVRMRDLIGAEVFVNLMIGRYHRPVEEERIFLFVDVVGSTAYAETRGDLKAQAYLSAVFAAVAEPVRRYQGSTDDFIGDMAMITWPMARGLQDARCVACVFAIREALTRDSAAWRERFGVVPEVRAALHGGSVVTAEVGVDRHKIAYFGDAVNVTARIETLCRTLDAPVLISADLLDLLPHLPPGVRATPLGRHTLRGRDQTLAVASLARDALPEAAAAGSGAAGRMRAAR
ncbi:MULTISPECIES: adenylate/guanylate cyclase domain-containing protein [unclassified Methylobacterium]|uniref:adenylate/guanylate cyclase domain-containing protein n=1 Tax=unclassified Methylobacterium TaxID=2615210 RepID=UPI0004775433|nr:MULTISPECIES: adenylate/guanylate cyclase domain-containing protein [Methylobacterium]WFT83629.1 adenylate/guanylate cyclase domain-containing protein [Methylobacterium nodulans]